MAIATFENIFVILHPHSGINVRVRKGALCFSLVDENVRIFQKDRIDIMVSRYLRGIVWWLSHHVFPNGSFHDLRSKTWSTVPRFFCAIISLLELQAYKCCNGLVLGLTIQLFDHKEIPLELQQQKTLDIRERTQKIKALKNQETAVIISCMDLHAPSPDASVPTIPPVSAT